MKYYLIATTNGVLDVDYIYLDAAIAIPDDPTKHYISVRDNTPMRVGWQEIDKATFDALLPTFDAPLQPSTDDRITKLERVIDALLTGGVTP